MKGEGMSNECGESGEITTVRCQVISVTLTYRNKTTPCFTINNPLPFGLSAVLFHRGINPICVRWAAMERLYTIPGAKCGPSVPLG